MTFDHKRQSKGHNNEIDILTKLVSKLPGLGYRSAKKSVLHLLENKDTQLLPLIEALQAVHDTIVRCELCGNLDTQSPCNICTDSNRDKNSICVVEQVSDLWALERAGAFKGQYHVLGGVLSALSGVGPDRLAITQLVEKIKNLGIEEVILALSATVDGQTTSHYIADKLLGMDVRITRLSHGVPIGGELNYMDDGTLTMALKSRQNL